MLEKCLSEGTNNFELADGGSADKDLGTVISKHEDGTEKLK